jgi:hypothetical protein
MKRFYTLLGNRKNTLFYQAGKLVSLIFLMCCTSCSEGTETIASVDGNDLSRDEAKLMMQHLGYDVNSTPDWKLFINNWSEQQALKEELKERHPLQAELIKMRGDAFIGELSKYYLQEESLSTVFDSIVPTKELKAYYEKHKGEFALQDFIVKALYIKVAKGSKITKKIKDHYLLKNDKDLSKINSYAKLYAENFYFNDKQWVYFNEVSKDIPLELYNKDKLVLNRTKTYFSDDEYTYFINIIDYNVKDATPPLDFLEDQIKEIIISKRMNELKMKNEQSFLDKVKKKHEIKIHI